MMLESPVRPDPDGHARATRILVVEDNPFDSDLIRMCLAEAEANGAEILHAESIKAAQRILESAPVQLTLLDLGLPDGAGLEAINRLPAAACGAVIVVTGQDSPTLLTDALRLRAYDVLPKSELRPASLMRLMRLAQLQHQTETELRRSEGRFREVFDRSADAIFVHIDERIVFANPAAVRMLRGQTEAQIVGLSIWNILHPGSHAGARARIARLAGGEPIPFEDAGYLRFDGTCVDVEISVAPFVFNGRMGVQACARDISERKAAEARLREAERFARSTLDAPQNKNICVLDESGRILTANKAWHRFAAENGALHHAAYEKLNYLAVCDVSGDPDAQAVAEGIRCVIRGDAEVFEHEYACHSPGAQRWFVARVSRFVGDGPLRLVVSHENVTPRKRAELATIRMAKAYATLAAVNEALFRVEDEKLLYQRICDIAVELGGMRLAAVRLIELPGGWIRTAALSGEPRGFLGYRSVSIHRDVPEGRGPAADAVREGCTQVCNDYLADPRLVDWHAAAAQAGIASTISVPVHRGRQIIGTLSLYAGEKDWFDSTLVALVERIADNISFGLEGIEHAARRKETAASLRESEERFRALTELSSDWYWEQEAQYRFVQVGAGSSAGLKDSSCGDIGRTHWEIPGIMLSEAAWAAHRAVLDERKPFKEFEYAIEGESGAVRHVSISGMPVFGPDGRFNGYRGIGRDISEKMRASQLLALEHSVARTLADAGDAAGGIRAVLEAVCRTERFEFGRFWELDEESGEISAATEWHVASPAVDAYLAGSRARRLPSGYGLIGSVCRSGEPAWVRDAQHDERILLPDFFAVAGMRGTCLLPVFANGRAIGVFVFSGRAVREPDEQLLAAARSIGAQAGQSLLRWRNDERLKRFRAAVDVSADLVLLIDPHTLNYVDVNETACRMLGYSREELLAMGPLNIFSASREELSTAYAGLIEGRTDDVVTHGVYRCKDGSTLPIESCRRAVPSEQGAVIVSVARDLRGRLRAEEELRRSNERYELVTRATQDVVWDWNINTDEVWWSRNFSTVFGHSPAEFRSIVLSWMERIHPDDHDRVVESMLAAVDRCEETWTCEYRFRRADGSYAQVFDRGTIVKDEQGKPLRMIGAMADVTERKAAEEKLAFMAQFDALTGLPNRILLRDRLDQAIARAGRRGRSVGVLFLDLDRFKLVNDTLGHQVGDRLIAEVAARLNGCVRDGDTVGRISGDEFAVVLEDMAQADDAAMVARKILAAFESPFVLEGSETFVTASIGASVYPADSAAADTLLKNADAAMYSAKENGRNRLAFYTAELDERSSTRLRLSTELRHAIERQEFVLHYQPKVDLQSGVISGFEALLRWQHPVRGLVPPLAFIPVLEDTGLIVPVGEWIVRSVCGQLQRWRAAGLALRPVAINLSARQFQQKGLDTLIGRILDETGVEPGLLEFELTESLLMSDAEEAIRVLNELRTRGVRLSVDDFGTGYSSLAYLKRFPLDCLKIDRAFIRDCVADPNDAAIALAIINLAHTLELKVVAEGVETAAQIGFLKSRGCDQIQGYYFSRPLPAADCTRMLAEDRRLPGAGIDADTDAVSILLLDDYRYDLELMREKLEPAGYRVLLADTPEAALETLATCRVNAVISDHSMPGTSGVKFLASVRQLYPDVLRILFSGSGDANAAAAGVNDAGIHKFLSKNWDETRLRSEIREALLRHRMEAVRP